MPLILAEYAIERDYSFNVGGYHFGFFDADHSLAGEVTVMQLGPFGEYHHVPFSAAHGWLIVALVFVTLLTAILAAGAWLRRHSARIAGR